MNILICGYGFVGMAHALSLQPYYNTHIYDPMKGYETWVDCDAAIIAVSTPENEDGSCNMSNVYQVIERIKDDVPILIKSTISLEGWELIKRAYPKRQITFSPEYLRANHAMEDFKNQKSVSIGGGDTTYWLRILSTLSIPVEIKNPEILILTKYFRNSYLAMKVAFFNQMYDRLPKLVWSLTNYCRVFQMIHVSVKVTHMLMQMIVVMVVIASPRMCLHY